MEDDEGFLWFPRVSLINFLWSLGWFLVGRRRPSRALPTEVGSDALGEEIYMSCQPLAWVHPMENVFPVPPKSNRTSPNNKDSGIARPCCCYQICIPGGTWLILSSEIEDFQYVLTFVEAIFVEFFFSLSISLSISSNPSTFLLNPFSKNLHQVP